MLGLLNLFYSEVFKLTLTMISCMTAPNVLKKLINYYSYFISRKYQDLQYALETITRDQNIQAGLVQNQQQD